jgi:hypothetical protein
VLFVLGAFALAGGSTLYILDGLGTVNLAAAPATAGGPSLALWFCF